MDLALNNLQRLICHKTHQTKPNQSVAMSKYFLNNGDFVGQFEFD